ncbi:MAG: cation-translocating P-type ATPase C-terminal domain-containing protein [Candidatus Methanoperedens sp.]|nr:cation-translocating P-type ATPase C-terminal domain-containing protein [Candidatus Methanoperedens sp.]
MRTWAAAIINPAGCIPRAVAREVQRPTGAMQHLPWEERTAMAQTTAFATLIVFELFNALNSRSLEHSILRAGFFTNKRLLQAVLKTAPLGFEAWIRILLVSSTVVVTAEIMKKWIIHDRKR